MLVLLPGIWSECSVTGQDEYWLSFRTALEMQERSEWLTPYVDGEVRLQKPPLLYWLMRLSFLAFGPSPFAARVWTVVFGALFALYTAKLARRFGSGGWLAGLFALASAGVAIEARRAMFDLPVACFATMAFHQAACWQRGGRAGALLAAGALLGLAAMTKGPVALWFFAAPCLAALWLRRARPAGPWWHVAPASAVLLAVALPWPLWVSHAHPEFWDVMATQAEHRSFGFAQLRNLPKLVGSTLGLCVPWSVAVAVALWHALRRGGEDDGPGDAAGDGVRAGPRRTARWLVCWVGLGLVPFAFMDAFERYTIALTAPLSMLAAAWLDRQPAASRRRHLTIAASLLAVPMVLFAAFALWFGLAIVWPLVALVQARVTWLVAHRTEPLPRLVAGLAAVSFAVLLGFVYPALGIHRLPDDLPADLAATPTATLGRPQPGMLSIRRGASVSELPRDPDALAVRLGTFRGYVFVLDADRGAVEAAARTAGVPLEEILSFRSFYSRKAWLKFFRDGAGWPEWREALEARDPAPLQPRFVCFRVG